jgi:orotidine 5'-phosphate decarboxylase subfamily 2
MNFTQRLRTIQKSKKSLVCVGLDTDPTRIPQALRSYEDPVLEFNRRIIEATFDLVCAYKLNLAFYESLGERGWSVLRKTLSYIPEGIITIGDAKRGDIGNTAEMYARALLVDQQFSATTVNPYMGFDSVEPFIRNPHQGAFILAVTSNPGAKDFQYRKSGKRFLYEHVIRSVNGWNTKKNCGLVVGATRPNELRRVRTLAPDLPVLIPGVGAQGGDLESAVRYGCDRKGYLAVINSSRGIIYASGDADFAGAARNATSTLRDAINHLQSTFFKHRR